jgi:hypothetical protein
MTPARPTTLTITIQVTASPCPHPARADQDQLRGALDQNASGAAGTGYHDVLSALRAAGFQHVDMVGGGGIHVISVMLCDPAGEGPHLLIGENADLLDLPPRQDLDGWRVLFRPSTDPDDITIYAGSSDVANMVRHAVEFAAMNGFPLADRDGS